MKYRQLLERILSFSEDQLNADMTCETSDGELVPCTLDIFDARIDDRLDDGHPIITCYLDE